MGYQLEMNWYLVLKGGSIHEVDDGISIDAETTIVKETYHTSIKSGFRVYPIGAVVPIIIDDKATGLAYIRETGHFLLGREPKTTVAYDMVMTFKDNDPVAEHYTDMYLAYKKKQEKEDHGGKFKLADWVNALERRSFEEALKGTSFEPQPPKRGWIPRATGLKLSDSNQFPKEAPNGEA